MTMVPDGIDSGERRRSLGNSDAVRSGLSGRPVVVGEVLFDHFPDGSQRLGGAPFNVAWHLEALRFEPLLLTRVGADPSGDRIVREMIEWGLDVSGVQRDAEHPTGQVRVRLDSGEPAFEIAGDQAYDYLQGDIDLKSLVGGSAALVYHGTLIGRSELSCRAVQTLRSRSEVPVFLDVNLRPPWWSEGTVKQLLFGASWVKLNLAELSLLSEPARGRPNDPVAAAQRFRDTFALDAVIVTRGAQGALLVTRDRVVDRQPPAVVRPVDTVGAGDAFSAVLVAGLIAGWEPELSLARALDLSALICTVRGAVMDDREVYSGLLDEWREAS